MKKSKKELFISLVFLVAFTVWTIAVKFIDVQNVGPMNTPVGFAALNSSVHRIFGLRLSLYTITDWLGLVPIAVVIFFALVGLYQLIKRKSLLKVDFDILVLGVFYVVVIVVFMLFEIVVINFRPVLINGVLEASYPSSTTMLSVCVMLTLDIVLRSRILNKRSVILYSAIIYLFTTFMVIARLISGVHWVSDIIGGLLVSFGLVLLFCYFFKMKGK